MCVKICIFNEMGKDVGEAKVRGDAHTHTALQTCTGTHRHVNICN